MRKNRLRLNPSKMEWLVINKKLVVSRYDHYKILGDVALLLEHQMEISARTLFIFWTFSWTYDFVSEAGKDHGQVFNIY